MASSVLLAGIAKKSVSEFHKDISAILKVEKEMDIYFSQSHSDLGAYMKKFDKLVNDFNKKYKGLKLKLTKRAQELKLRVFLDEKSLRDAFERSAARIQGIQAIGANSYDAASAGNADQFAAELDRAKKKMYLTYYSQENGSSKVFMLYDENSKKAELVHSDDLGNEPSAEFQIAAFYALNSGYNKNIKIFEEASTFGFSNFPHYKEKREHLDRQDPYLTE